MNVINGFLVSNDEIDSIKNYYQKFTKIDNNNYLKDEELKIAQKFTEFQNEFNLKINKSGLEKRKNLNEAENISNKKKSKNKYLNSLIDNFSSCDLTKFKNTNGFLVSNDK